MNEDERIMDNLKRDCNLVEIELDRPLSPAGGHFAAYRLRGRLNGEVMIQEPGSATLKGAATKFRDAYARADQRGLLGRAK